MKITIEIPKQPEGFSVPRWCPIYLPFGTIRILVGKRWCWAIDELKHGGGSYIWCEKLTERDGGEARIIE